MSENYLMSGTLGYIFSAGAFITLGWGDVLAALIIGFVGAVGGILANMLYKYIKNKLK